MWIYNQEQPNSEDVDFSNALSYLEEQWEEEGYFEVLSLFEPYEGPYEEEEQLNLYTNKRIIK